MLSLKVLRKHPSLQARGSTSRCSGWKNSLKFKMANYRTKRRRSGCLDVAVNAGKRGGHSTEGEPANENIKKAKKGQINYLPNFPEGFNQVALEDARKDLVNEMQTRTPNGQLVKEKMGLTFALRRKGVVESEPAICETVERWPALFTEDQDSDDDDSFRHTDIGILLVEPEGAVPSSSLRLSPASLKIITEGEMVMDNIQDLPKAMCLLFGLAYAVHLNYPRSMKFTFQFIQQVLLELGHVELKPKLH